MARVRWHGHEFTADPIRQLPNGDWLMKTKGHGPRFTFGTEVMVKPDEIVEMAAAETPPSDGLAELEAAMAEERKTLTPVAELLAKAPKTVETKAE